MKTKVLEPIVALMIVGAAGFLIGKNTTPAPDSDSNDTSFVLSERRLDRSSSASAGRTKRSKRVQSAKDAMALPSQNERLQALMDYYAGLVPAQFRQEVENLQSLPWGERTIVDHLLLTCWGEKDPIAAMDYAKTLGLSKVAVSGTLMQGWAAQSPQDAAAYYAKQPSGFPVEGWKGVPEGVKSTASVIASELARQGPEAAMKWAESLEGHSKPEAVLGVIMTVASENPAEAAAMLSTITDAATKEKAQNSLIANWARKNWEEASGWIGSLPVGDQINATGIALPGLADSDPEAAAGNLFSLPEGVERDKLTADIARQWSTEDPARAAQWLMKNCSGTAQKDGIQSVVSLWTYQDPETAFEFVKAQPKGDIRDKALSAYTISNTSGDPGENFKLAASIENERDRSAAIYKTARRWVYSDGEAALNYVNSTSTLSDKDRDAVVRLVDRQKSRR